ncbi:putative late blight resistance protein homolog R1A-4 [Coffea arabica]|uniref:Late blight resistance protein homolog R1A-4 n=1 Tax=Coffea arabica TaxID=13443 RepID=A0A6P6X2P3_COFAR
MQLDIVAIVGMSGLGKTTLASKVYSDPLVLFHFHIHAWCYVSHGYSKRSLLVQILCCFDGGNSIQWDMLKHSLPDVCNGSRLLTSRIQNLSLQIKPDSKPHHLRWLSDKREFGIAAEEAICQRRLSSNIK